MLPCVACGKCWSNNKPCIFNDDSNQLEEVLFKTDIIVLVGPVYWYTFNAQMKLMLDKLYPYIEKKLPRPLPIKQSYLLACCFDDSLDTFSGMVQTYLDITKYMKWEDAGQLLVTKVGLENDIDNNVALEQAYTMANNIE
ncbi:NAD(P)H-dependent oxidoreductase [Erysipelotrichaceae bacterium OttesenSCG-928-M19]|nr:NAD(P)H-dependent oxidoreductase [Erysipelotrichaceae bacterium OttesenSCG-928-M19]